MRFSSRIPTDWTPSPWSTAADRLRSPERIGKPFIDLTISSPLAAGIRWDSETLLAALAKEQPWCNWKPDARGSQTVREALCRYETSRGFACAADEFLLASSTSEAYSILFRAFCDPHDSILVPRPGYPLLDVLAGFDFLECVGYDLQINERGAWRIDFASLRAAPESTRMVLVVNPNNPTGSMLSPEEWGELGELCAERNWSLVVDEVFSDYVSEEQPQPPWRDLAQKIPIFRLHGLSKCVGLPQLKLAWIWVGCPDGERQAIENALEFVADAYLSLSALPEALAPTLLEQQGAFRLRVQERISTNWKIAESRLFPIVDILTKPLGGWYACLRKEGIDDENFSVGLANESATLIQPGYFFDFAEDGWLVISLLAQPEVFSQGIHCLAERLLAVE